MRRAASIISFHASSLTLCLGGAFYYTRTFRVPGHDDGTVCFGGPRRLYVDTVASISAFSQSISTRRSGSISSVNILLTILSCSGYPAGSFRRQKPTREQLAHQRKRSLDRRTASEPRGSLYITDGSVRGPDCLSVVSDQAVLLRHRHASLSRRSY